MSDTIPVIITIESSIEMPENDSYYEGHLFGVYPDESEFNEVCKNIESDDSSKRIFKAVIYAGISSDFSDYRTSNYLISDIRIDKEKWSVITFGVFEFDAKNTFLYYKGTEKAHGFMVHDYAGIWENR